MCEPTLLLSHVWLNVPHITPTYRLMSTIGTLFRVTTFGESHGVAVGCVLDGVPAGVEFREQDVQPFLDRRRPGQSTLTTARSESDRVEILSGVEDGRTLGTPIAMIVRNQDMRKKDYEETSKTPRPGHADYTYQMKYGIRASSGGGRASARETIGRVCAGAFAMKFLSESIGVKTVAFVDSVMEISIPEKIRESFLMSPPTQDVVDRMSTLVQLEDGSLQDVEGVRYNPSDGSVVDIALIPNGSPFIPSSSFTPVTTRCPHGGTAARMHARITAMKQSKNSCGGTITGIISGLPAGLGEPVFEKFHAELGKAMMSIPAVKGFEIGSGFQGSRSMTGAEHNDRFTHREGGKLTTETNHAGGVLGGVTSGTNVYFRVALKPVSSIGLSQETVDFSGNPVTLELVGRHDPCVLPRAVPIMEAMAAITTLDLFLRQKVR